MSHFKLEILENHCFLIEIVICVWRLRRISLTPPLILLFWAAQPQVGALGALFGHFGAPWNPWNCPSSIPLWNVRISRFCCFQASKDLGKKGHMSEFTAPLIVLTQNWWVWVWHGSLWTFETEPPKCTLLTLSAAPIKHSPQDLWTPPSTLAFSSSERKGLGPIEANPSESGHS